MITDYELIIFDWDGTLVNSIDWIVECIQSGAIEQNFHQPDTQACKDVIGLSLSEAMFQLFPTITTSQKADMVSGYRKRYLSKPSTANDLFLDSLDVLDELKRLNKTMAIATGKGQSGLDRALDGTGTRHFFSECRCGDTMKSKPSPHMLFDIMQATNTNPEQTIMIGDSTLDLEMANNAGVASIGVTTGAHSYAKLNALQPLSCINALTEIFTR
ncbi:MAG: hydrolase [Piscirickettsiaceae bacterium]|nr:MAG: hydrolase [Piscirickettsiaceae bacterium]